MPSRELDSLTRLHPSSPDHLVAQRPGVEGETNLRIRLDRKRLFQGKQCLLPGHPGGQRAGSQPSLTQAKLEPDQETVNRSRTEGLNRERSAHIGAGDSREVDVLDHGGSGEQGAGTHPRRVRQRKNPVSSRGEVHTEHAVLGPGEPVQLLIRGRVVDGRHPDPRSRRQEPASRSEPTTDGVTHRLNGPRERGASRDSLRR